MPHIALLGDSVFDNGAYVGNGADVISSLRRAMPPDWDATRLAVDGTATTGIARQLEGLPSGTTHLFVSVGGHDALDEAYLIGARSPSVAQSLMLGSKTAEAFRGDYTRMLDAVLAVGLPTVVCTIYDPRFPVPSVREMAKIALMVFNDAILREAAHRRLPVLDLRLICDEDADFVATKEPSAQGGAKIASAILAIATQHDFSRPHCEIYGR